MIKKKAVLLLEDGTVYNGLSFGWHGEKTGEVVFNTALTGYEEILTDPSYSGQIVTMCYPHIGNYGINFEDGESYKIWLDGVIVKEYSNIYSNYRAKTSLAQYLKDNKVMGFEGIDTRSLVRKLRDKGAMRAIFSAKDTNTASLKKKLKAVPSISDMDLVSKVNKSPVAVYRKFTPKNIKGRPTIAVLDYGIKLNIVRSLQAQGLNVMVLPCNTQLKMLLQLKPDGVFLSNGPGDPESAEYGIKLARDIMNYNKDNYLPLMGICLGHQLIGLGSGAKTFKLKFGHHGGNHPVKDLETTKIEITSQNHNYCVDPDTLPGGFEITHMNLNDNTVEGMKHKTMPIISYQYHPEACPGPRDSSYIFSRFKELLNG
jgi:carbamoyl-phosphate synthase small subunit